MHYRIILLCLGMAFVKPALAAEASKGWFSGWYAKAQEPEAYLYYGIRGQENLTLAHKEKAAAFAEKQVSFSKFSGNDQEIYNYKSLVDGSINVQTTLEIDCDQKGHSEDSATFIKGIKKLGGLKLSYENNSALWKALEENLGTVGLKTFALEFTGGETVIDYNVINHIFEKNPTLEEVTFTRILQNNIIPPLSDGLAVQKNLKKLLFKGSYNLNGESLSSLANLLPNLKTLHTLHYGTWNDVGDSTNLMAAAIKVHPTLKNVTFSICSDKDYLGSAVPLFSNPRIESLSINGWIPNNFAAASYQAVAEALKNNKTLTFFSLYTILTQEGAQAFFKGIIGNRTLKELVVDMSSSIQGNEAFKYLTAFLADNTGLEKLSIRSLKITDEDLITKFIETLLKRPYPLKTLDFPYFSTKALASKFLPLISKGTVLNIN